MKNFTQSYDRMQNQYQNRNVLKPRSFLNVLDLTKEEFASILNYADEIKSNPLKDHDLLKGSSVSLIFQKTSTRTRCSFEAGIAELGGHSIYLDWGKTNFVLANLEDEIRVLSRYSKIIMARVFSHDTLITMANHSEVPIINGLCDLQHPCQALADAFTIKEYFSTLEGVRVCYIGDANNVFYSLAEACYLGGAEIVFAGPVAFSPKITNIKGKNFEITQDIANAVKGADVIYTDTWVSMGQEEETETRLKAFKQYCIDMKLFANLPEHVIFMHCLPAHRGYEVEGDVLDSTRSVVYDQAENRKHAQKSLMKFMLSERW